MGGQEEGGGGWGVWPCLSVGVDVEVISREGMTVCGVNREIEDPDIAR